MRSIASLIYERARKGELLGDLEIIDFHSHLGAFYNFYCPDSSASAMIRAMDLMGIKIVCVNAMQSISSDFHAGNLETLEAMKEYPERIIGFAVVNPHYSGRIKAELEYFCGEIGMKGIKIHPGSHECPVTDSRYTPVWEYAQLNKMPVLIHTWNSSICHPRLFDSLAKEYPDVSFVFGHSGMPDFKGAVDMANKHSNIYLELTAAAFNNNVIEFFIENAGAEKVIFGSDMGGWFSPIHGVGPVLYSRISDEDKKKILSGNAKRLLNI